MADKRNMAAHLLLCLLLMVSASANAQNNKELRGTVRSADNEPLAFVNIAMYSAADSTKFLKGTVTDKVGAYVLASPAAGDYLLILSSLGYETIKQKVTIGGDGNATTRDFTMSETAMALKGVTVEGRRQTNYADKSVYTFSDEQIKQARQSADLVSTVRDLALDPNTNKIAKAGGGTVKLLINGLNATDNDLKSIPANKILKVEYYTVPPARYATDGMGTLVNVITKRLDTGVALGVDARHAFTTMFGDDNMYLRLTSGNHQLAIDYSLSYRNYNDSYATRNYNFNVDGKESSYTYDTDRPFGYTTNDISLKYIYNKPDDITFQAVLKPSFMHQFETTVNKITATGNNQWRNGGGEGNNLTNTFGPSIDLYLNKKLKGGNELTVNVVGTYYHNRQENTKNQWKETATDILLNDSMNQKSHKYSIIGELIYTKTWGRNALSIGYKGMAGKSKSTISNHLTGGYSYDYNSSNSSHYAYAEFGGASGKLSYKVSAGGTYVATDNDDTNYNTFLFTPQASLSYNMKKSSVQMYLSSTPVTPTISQLSNNSEQMIPGLVRQGNPYLKSGNNYNVSLYYLYNHSWFNFIVGLSSDYTDKPISTYYKYGTVGGEDCIVSTSENALCYWQNGGYYSLTIKPLGNETLRLRMGGNVLNQRISSDIIGVHSHWYAPMWYMVDYNKGRFGASYMGGIVSRSLNGAYLSDDENSGHLQVYYQHKQIRITAGCLWLFTKSKYHSETLDNNVMNYSSDNYINDNKSMVTLGISWNLFKGKNVDVDKKLDNKDNDRGTF